MEKQEAIKQAYKQIGLPFNENVSWYNGWLRIKPNQYSSFYNEVDLLKLTSHIHSIRPKSLKGIEDNNGWIKIESENDLPKNSCSCWIEVKYQYTNTPFWYDCTKKCFSFKGIILQANEVSHYIPVEQPKQRIY